MTQSLQEPHSANQANAQATFENGLASLGLLPGQTTQTERPDRIQWLDFPAAYRALCAQLALAHARLSDSSHVEQLEALAAAGHRALYAARKPGLSALWQFVSSGLPQSIRRERRCVLSAAALLFVPGVLLIALLQFYPNWTYFILSPEAIHTYETMYAPTAARPGWSGSAAESQWLMYGYYIMNNVGIDLQCFAGGIVFGLGSVFYLLFNGAMIGAVAGHLTFIGYGGTFWPFVAGHSGPELIGAVLSGAAGLKLGYGLIAPGRLKRTASLGKAAREAVPLLLGAMLLTFCAAFIEAFWSSNKELGFTLRITVGIAISACLILYFTLGGRRAN